MTHFYSIIQCYIQYLNIVKEKLWKNTFFPWYHVKIRKHQIFLPHGQRNIYELLKKFNSLLKSNESKKKKFNRLSYWINHIVILWYYSHLENKLSFYSVLLFQIYIYTEEKKIQNTKQNLTFLIFFVSWW